MTQNKQTFEVSVRFLHATASVRVEEDLQTFFNGSAQSLSFCMLQLLSELKKIYTDFFQRFCSESLILHATASVRVEEDLQTFFNGSAQNLSFCMLQLLSELKKIYRLFSTLLLRISHCKK